MGDAREEREGLGHIDEVGEVELEAVVDDVVGVEGNSGCGRGPGRERAAGERVDEGGGTDGDDVC